LQIRRGRSDIGRKVSMASQIELLQKGLALLKKFLELTRQTAQAGEEKDFSTCASLLQARAELLEEFTKQQKKLTPLPALRPENPNSATIAGAVMEMRDLYREIAAYDQQVGERLQKEKDQIGEKIRMTQQGQKALRGYNPRRPHTPKYCDKRG
jgi:hypothetical protein